MSIAGRGPIHKNTSQNRNTPTNHSSQETLSEGTSGTSFDNDESQESISDSELTNTSSILKKKLKAQSPAPTRKKQYGTQEALLVSENAGRNNSNQTKFQTTQSQKEGVRRRLNRRSYRWIFIIAVAVALAAVIIRRRTVVSVDTLASKWCNFSNLRVKYKNEDNYLWTHLTSGIENILNDRSDKPAVYLLVHSGGKVTKDLIKDIAKTSSSCFDSSMKPVEIDPLDFTSEEAVRDYGYVIEKYKEKIQEGNVILIANLNEIPAKAAQALHTICDTHTPIAPKVIIFLSLMAEHNGAERVIDTAQEALRDLWEPTISLNKLDPLIARVTDEVILLKSK